MCVSCREHAVRTCLRCEAPLCPSHEPAANDERCADCEAGFQELKKQIVATPWEPSLQREAFVLFASVIIKVAMMGVAVVLLLWALGEFPHTNLVVGSSASLVVALLAVRRLHEGPNKKKLARRARRTFLKQHIRAIRTP